MRIRTPSADRRRSHERITRGSTWGATTVALAALLAGCSDTAPRTSSSPVSSAPAVAPASPGETAAAPVAPGDPEIVASGLEAPWSIAFVDDTAIVSERDSGRILELTDDGTTHEITTVAGVAHGGEGGLLGLAVDGRDLYVYSTAADGNRIERYPLSGEAGSLSVGEPETILDGLPSSRTHNGGRLGFGPDGMLYASVGDAGARDAAQDVDALNGKILRMTPGGDVPEDNPFPGSLVYSLGHRNVQGFAWAENGTMLAAEFGQDTWDELNVIEAGANYGWPVVEGAAGNGDFVDPVQQWTPDDASPSGIAVAGGTLFIANLRGQSLRGVPLASPSTTDDYLSGTDGRLRDAVLAPDGSLWVLTNNTDGRGAPGPDDDRILRLPLSPTPTP